VNGTLPSHRTARIRGSESARHASLSGLLVSTSRRCANATCEERGRLWPHWLQRSDPIEFESERYCRARCAAPAFEREIQAYLEASQREQEAPHRLPLGLLLVARGVISGQQLKTALQLQRDRPGRRLGSLLKEMGVLGERALIAALGVQWGCPVFPVEGHAAYLECAGLLPFALLDWARILPVHHSADRGVLHLAFTQRVDHTLLYALEPMIGCRVVPCVTSDRVVNEALHRLQRFRARQETVFDSVLVPRDMAGVAADYAGQLRTSHVQLAGAAGHVWFRLANARRVHHLLFRIASSVHIGGLPSS
jgi:MshEN domain